MKASIQNVGPAAPRDSLARSSNPIVAAYRADDGFALASVLVVAILLSLFATALVTSARIVASESSMFVSGIGARAATEAGLNRIIFAFSRSGDSLREALVPDGRPVRWDFRGKTLLLRAQAESGKLDVNAGDRSHIAALLGMIINDRGVRSRFLANIDQSRSSGARIASLAALLPPFDRMTARLDIVESHFTVMTNQRGFDPVTAPLVVVETIPELLDQTKNMILTARAERRPLPLAEIPAHVAQRFSTERPIYTFRADTFAGFTRAGAMSAVVGFSDQTGATVYTWAPAGIRK